MSMWDWDEPGESYPPDERQQHRDPYASHSGSSEYHGAHQSWSDHSHHHHSHGDHSHDQHHHGQDNAHSYHGQQYAGASPSRMNYGVQHDSYSYADAGSRQNYRHESAGDSYENRENSYGSPTYASNMAHAPARQAAPYGDQQGYDASAGYEIRQEHHARPPASGHSHEASNPTELFSSTTIVNLTLDEIDALARVRRSRSWLVVLYAPWCRFCQAMEPNFERVAQHLESSNIYVGKFRADGDYKEYAKRYLQLEHFPTILFFPKNTSNIIKYNSENQEVDALLGFVQAYR